MCSSDLNSLTILPEIRLVRRLRFKILTLAEVTGAVGGGLVAFAVAWLDGGAWALAAQQLATYSIKGIFLWSKTPWRPRFRYDSALLRDLRSFSGYMLGSQVMNYIRFNADNIIVGFILNSSALGAYALAFILTETIRSQLASVSAKVLFPVYVGAIRDPEGAIKIYLNVIRYMCLLIWPITALLVIRGGDIIEVAFGSMWLEAAGPVSILAFSSALMALNGDPSSLLKAAGRARAIFHIGSTTTVVVGIPAITFGTYLFGVTGAAYGVLLQTIVQCVLMQITVQKVAKIPVHKVLHACFPALIATIFSFYLCNLIIF